MSKGITMEEAHSIQKNWELQNLRKKLTRLQESILRMKIDNDDYAMIQRLQQELDRTAKEIADKRI